MFLRMGMLLQGSTTEAAGCRQQRQGARRAMLVSAMVRRAKTACSLCLWCLLLRSRRQGALATTRTPRPTMSTRRRCPEMLAWAWQGGLERSPVAATAVGTLWLDRVLFVAIAVGAADW